MDGSPISAVACGIEEADGLLWEVLLALARRRLVMFGGGEDIRRRTRTIQASFLGGRLLKHRTEIERAET
jgi:hypothetical protein